MKTLRETLAAEMSSSGVDVKDQKIELLISRLNSIFEHEWDQIELTARINEIEQALTMQNKIIIGGKIMEDFSNREMIHPKLLMLRLQGLKKSITKNNIS